MDCPHRIPPQEHWHHTTRCTEIATPDYTQDTTGKTEKEETNPHQSLDTANIVAPDIINCPEANPDHNNWTGTATIEAAQDDPIQHTGDIFTGHTMTHHTSHTTNPPHIVAHHATALRIAVDHTHNCLQLSKHSSHQKGPQSSGLYSSQGNRKSHLRRNMKV